ncbi:serine/threonine-protein kinase [Streptomyces sediminimaris]|uniref:serine/threonine-protein kinase n=1 Tax=Streptomyces sediminimaris TaxID=3383721 RepID=UPI003999CCF9
MKARRSAALPATAPIWADPKPPHILGDRYRLGARVGSGGMADVYEAVDTRLGRPVAVKLFRPGSDPESEDRLAAEAVLLARLEHPGLVTVYDSGRHDDRAYLVMQLVDGPTLRGLLTSGALSQRRVAALGTALARALVHVHRAGIVHRDIKPSNVLLDRAGAPHLADFGIARLADATRRTAPDALTGTAAYLAPEQVEGGHVGPPTDVYALGLVLLECVKGELEYQGTLLEAAIARLHRPPTIPAWLAPGLANLLLAMTARDPEARPDAGQCAAVLASLDPDAGSDPASPPFSASAAASAAPVTAPEATRTKEAAVRSRLPAGVRHNRRLAVGTALAALSVALGTTLTVASGTGGQDGNRADASSSAAHPPSGTATPRSGPGSTPSTRPHRASGPPAGSRTQPTGTNRGSFEEAALVGREPAGHRGSAPHGPAAHRPPGKDDSAHPTSQGTARHPAKPGKHGKHGHGPGRHGHG